jgi:hypothetical protein
MRTSLFATVLLTAAVASNAQAQVDHLQCHKVKDSIKFSDAVVALAAQQAAFQLPGNCSVSGKAAEFCVPVDKNVIDLGDAPGSLIGPGQDLSDNDYICYKIKCPKFTIADTLATDQFGERSLTKIKTAGKLCVPAVKGVVIATTTTTTTTTTTLPTSGCPQDGSATGCNAAGSGGSACSACCMVTGTTCEAECGQALSTACTVSAENTQCAAAINAQGCADECCGTPTSGCPQDGSTTGCNAAGSGGSACSACCMVTGTTCEAECSQALSNGCAVAADNMQCAAAINAQSCGDECCP